VLAWRQLRAWLHEHKDVDPIVETTAIGFILSNIVFLAGTTQQATSSDLGHPMLMELWNGMWLSVNTAGVGVDARMTLTIVFERHLAVPTWISSVVLEGVAFDGAVIYRRFIAASLTSHPAYVQKFPLRILFAQIIEQGALAFELSGGLTSCDGMVEPSVLEVMWSGG
jgi:hypothetical protein